MADKQDGLRKHIKSAKGWLGRAESSLDNNNEVRGDLSIMLAQAELQHAQEAKHKSLWLIWLKRLSPVLIALLVGAGYMALLRPTDAKVIFVQPDAVSSEAVGPEKPQKAAQGEDIHTAGTKAQTQAGPAEPDASAEQVKPDSVSSDAAASSEIIAREGQPSAGVQGEDNRENTVENKDSRYSLQSSANTVSLGESRTESSAEMQKLMQSAGKILRE